MGRAGLARHELRRGLFALLPSVALHPRPQSLAECYNMTDNRSAIYGSLSAPSPTKLSRTLSKIF